MGNEHATESKPTAGELFVELTESGPLSADLTRKVCQMLTLTGSERLVENDTTVVLRLVGGAL